MLFALLILAATGCQDMLHIRKTVDIKGSWYGSVGKNPFTRKEQYIRLDLGVKEAEISTYFTTYDGGWHDAIGTYTYDGKDTIKLNIDLGKCAIPNESTITLLHAVVTESGSIYEAGKTVTILGLWYDKVNSYGEYSKERVWLNRERPDM